MSVVSTADCSIGGGGGVNDDDDDDDEILIHAGRQRLQISKRLKTRVKCPKKKKKKPVRRYIDIHIRLDVHWLSD